jgi:hypothetical protein
LIRISNAANGLCALVLLLILAQSCQTGRAATEDQASEDRSGVVADGDNAERPRDAMTGERLETKTPPTPSGCPRLPEVLLASASTGPSTQTRYPSGIDIENGKVRLIIETGASESYLKGAYHVDVESRMRTGDFRVVRVPLDQLCDISDDPLITSISIPERSLTGPPGIH